MLTRTFCHIPGVGPKTELNLWAAGATSWQNAGPHADLKLPRSLRQSWSQHLQESQTQYAQRNAAYFLEHLPPRQQWRVYGDFQDSCAFLDIETTGLSAESAITTIALYDGRTIRSFVHGINLDEFPEAVQAYQLLVTYNGKAFDVPFLERTFRRRLPQGHLDVMYALRSLGLKGGLKGCERQVGIVRRGLEEVDGFVAVLLWEEFRRHGNRRALETLLAYNICDAVNLHALMVHAYNAKLQATPFADRHTLPAPLLPELPFAADAEVLARVLPHALRPWFPARPSAGAHR